MEQTAWRATSTSTPARVSCFLAVDLQRQLLPGTFEHALNHLIDHELDLSSFDVRFRGKKKVDAQWKLYCLVHNIEKLAHHGYAQE